MTDPISPADQRELALHSAPNDSLANSDLANHDTAPTDVQAVEMGGPEPAPEPELEAAGTGDTVTETPEATTDELEAAAQETAAQETTDEPSEEATADEASKEATDEPAANPFEGIPEPLQHALKGRGFDELTSVQRAVLEHDGDVRDLRISSQTGSGKTVALGLAMAPALLKAYTEHGPRGVGPRALVVAPTRELAMQVREELDWLYRHVNGTRVVCVTGGTNIFREKQRLMDRPTILVGTPGRLLDHHRSGVLDLDDIRHLVLDEADQMLDLGFKDELDAILDAAPPTRRTHLVSATFPELVKRLADRCQEDAISVEGTALGAANEDIDHIAHRCFPNERFDALVNLLLLTGGQRTLVFVRTRMDTASIAEDLEKLGFGAAPLSGDLAQRQRTRTLDSFREGRVSVLVATDVAARGLDVQDVTTVIHMDPVFDGEVYTHRSGRTGRAGNHGRSVLLVPFKSERGVRRMLNAIRIEARWDDLPTAERVTKKLKGRRRKALHAELDTFEPKTEALERATDLLKDRSPEHVVATLLAKLHEDSCEPRQINIPEAPRERPHRRDRDGFERGPRDDRGGFDRGPRDDRGGFDRGGFERGPRPPRGPAQDGVFEKFTLNWGGRRGANPKRVLAHICRRGGISSRDVGAIRIFATESVIEIAAPSAASFAHKVRTPDAREPHLVIERQSGGGRPDRQHGGGRPERHGFQGRPDRQDRGQRFPREGRGRRFGNRDSR